MNSRILHPDGWHFKAPRDTHISSTITVNLVKVTTQYMHISRYVIYCNGLQNKFLILVGRVFYRYPSKPKKVYIFKEWMILMKIRKTKSIRLIIRYRSKSYDDNKSWIFKSILKWDFSSAYMLLHKWMIYCLSQRIKHRLPLINADPTYAFD